MLVRLLYMVTLVSLIGSTFLAPAGVVMAAPEWTCGSVTVTSLNAATRQVTVALSHSTDPTEEIDLFWGDGMTVTVHSTTPSNTTFNDTQSHTYSTNGPFTITMKVYNPAKSDSHDCFTGIIFNGCEYAASKLTLAPMDSHHTVTATVSYSGTTALLDWGDSSTTALPAGNQSNLVRTHTYATSSGRTVQLRVSDASGNYSGSCSKQTTFTPSAVSVSSINVLAPQSGIDWAAIAFALLGLFVLGNVAVLAVIRRR